MAVARFSIEDCSPALQAKILAKLKEQEPILVPHYVGVYRLGTTWQATSATPNKKLVERTVRRFNLSSPATTFQTAEGKPSAFMIVYQMESK
jgi:hypothetical protein